MRSSLLLAVAFACMVACKDKDGSCTSASSGTCHENSVACGIQATCKGRQIELKCTPPPPDAKTIKCTCNENSVVGKAVELEFVSHASPFKGDTSKIVASACGL